MEQKLGDLALETLVSSTPLSLAVADDTGHLVYLSPALEAILGHAFEARHLSEWVTTYNLLAADGRTPLRTEDLPLAQALAGNVVTDAVVATRTVGDRYPVRYMRCNASPLLSRHGSPLGAVVLIQDVTRERLALDGQAALRERLLGALNHQLRTPSSTIIGHAELLDEAHSNCSAHVRRSIDAMAAAAEDILELAELMTTVTSIENRTRLTISAREVCLLLDDIVRHHADPAQRERIDLQADVDGEVAVDLGETRRAVAALIDNALAYGPPAGRVHVRARLHGDQLDISVCDEGGGIDECDWARLVQPFERGVDHCAQAGARGLGLALAHTVAVSHGGHLRRTLDATGHCVTLSIPATPTCAT